MTVFGDLPPVRIGCRKRQVWSDPVVGNAVAFGQVVAHCRHRSHQGTLPIDARDGELGPFMNLQLYSLMAAVVLGLVHLSAASFSFKAQVGNKYTVGPRDEGLQPTGVTARLYRANANFLETFPYFAVCVLVVSATGSGGILSQIGSVMYLAGRVLFLPLYAAGLPSVRTLSWNAATLGLVLVGAQYVVSELG